MAEGEEDFRAFFDVTSSSVPEDSSAKDTRFLLPPTLVGADGTSERGNPVSNEDAASPTDIDDGISRGPGFRVEAGVGDG